MDLEFEKDMVVLKGKVCIAKIEIDDCHNFLPNNRKHTIATYTNHRVLGISAKDSTQQNKTLSIIC